MHVPSLPNNIIFISKINGKIIMMEICNNNNNNNNTVNFHFSEEKIMIAPVSLILVQAFSFVATDTRPKGIIWNSYLIYGLDTQ